MRTNIVIPSEATHSSLDLFEKPPLLVTFDQSFEQKQDRFIRHQDHHWSLKLLVIATILLTCKKFTWRSSVEYFKQMERICATQLVMLMPVIFHILLIISFIHFSPTVLFLQMVSKFQQLMGTMHIEVQHKFHRN